MPRTPGWNGLVDVYWLVIVRGNGKKEYKKRQAKSDTLIYLCKIIKNFKFSRFMSPFIYFMVYNDNIG